MLYETGIRSTEWTAKWLSKNRLAWSSLWATLRSTEQLCGRKIEDKISFKIFPCWNMVKCATAKWICGLIMDREVAFKIELLLFHSAMEFWSAEGICSCETDRIIAFFCKISTNFSMHYITQKVCTAARKSISSQHVSLFRHHKTLYALVKLLRGLT